MGFRSKERKVEFPSKIEQTNGEGIGIHIGDRQNDNGQKQKQYNLRRQSALITSTSSTMSTNAHKISYIFLLLRLASLDPVQKLHRKFAKHIISFETERKRATPANALAIQASLLFFSTSQIHSIPKYLCYFRVESAVPNAPHILRNGHDSRHDLRHAKTQLLLHKK